MTGLRRFCVVLVLLFAPMARADAPGGLWNALELAGHRALARTRDGKDPAPFTTDGCSGGMSSVWALAAQVLPGFAATHGQAPPWEACCVAHDRAYHSAGPDPDPEASFQARLDADGVLRACVVATGNEQQKALADTYGVKEADITAGFALIGNAMFDAVRAGGAPCSGLAWRWGYGYPSCAVRLEDFQATPAD